MAFFVASAAVSCAASLTHTENVLVIETLSDNKPDAHLYVSVFNGRAGYGSSDGSVQGTMGDGTVQDYVFFNKPRLATSIMPYSKGDGSIIKSFGVNGGASVLSDANSVIKLWEWTDPGHAFNSTADHVKETMARAGNTYGTMDVTGIASGTVYFFVGTVGGPQEVSMTMSIGGRKQLLASSGYFRGSSNSFYVVSFDFETDGEYDTLKWEYVNEDADGSRARFGGVAIHAVTTQDRARIPEPNAYALLSGILALSAVVIQRRRKISF